MINYAYKINRTIYRPIFLFFLHFIILYDISYDFRDIKYRDIKHPMFNNYKRLIFNTCAYKIKSQLLNQKLPIALSSGQYRDREGCCLVNLQW